MLSSRSCSTPFPGFALVIVNTASTPISRRSGPHGSAWWIPTVSISMLKIIWAILKNINIIRTFILKTPNKLKRMEGFESFHDCVPFCLLDDAVRDCKIAFTCRSVSSKEDYSTGSTYFQRADQPPRCLLEALALEIFRKHTTGRIFDPTYGTPLHKYTVWSSTLLCLFFRRSGAEWWTQVIDSRDDIGFHWDRDYGDDLAQCKILSTDKVLDFLYSRSWRRYWASCIPFTRHSHVPISCWSADDNPVKAWDSKQTWWC